MTLKPQIKFLAAIWGARYIDEFARISMPSYLAAQNLPYMAARSDLECIILTSSDSREMFHKYPIFKRLEALCPIRYVFIDDLITNGVYGVTLTAAYARGILACGEDQTKSYFVFMNSDFILADGSLKSLTKLIEEGHPCIMAPSLRASTEIALPALEKRIGSDGILSIPPRQLVQIALDGLHPTVVAKTVTQNLVTFSTHNLIYWQVDANTLLARYHLLFMLAIKPEVPLTQVNFYCDYGFVPALVPSRKIAVIEDSDDLFMLELQSVSAEKQYIRCGKAATKDIATDLSIWTTREHRLYAQRDLVFKSGDEPASIAPARQALSAYMREIVSQLGEPASHLDHPYWLGGLRLWVGEKASDGQVDVPPELRLNASPAQLQNLSIPRPPKAVSAGPAKSGAKQPVARRPSLYEWLLRTYRRLTGVFPKVPLWHYMWHDSKAIFVWIDEIKRRGKVRNLLVHEDGSTLRSGLPRYLAFESIMRLDDYAQAGNDKHSASDQKFDNIFIQTYYPIKSDVLRAVLHKATSALAPNGSVALFVHLQSPMVGVGIDADVAMSSESLLPPDWIKYRVRAYFNGGVSKMMLRGLEVRMLQRLKPGRLRQIPVALYAASAWGCIAVMTAVNNLIQGPLSDEQPRNCSSVLIVLGAPQTIEQKSL